MKRFINLWLKALQLDLWNWKSVPKTIIEILTTNSYLAISFEQKVWVSSIPYDKLTLIFLINFCSVSPTVDFLIIFSKIATPHYLFYQTHIILSFSLYFTFIFFHRLNDAVKAYKNIFGFVEQTQKYFLWKCIQHDFKNKKWISFRFFPALHKTWMKI